MLRNKIKSLVQEYRQEFVEVRRYLHAHPEISYREFETSKYVQQKLAEFHVPFEIKATTGVVGIIKGRNPDSRVIALRADMDALPIKEENEVVYRSVNEGLMHACGHDVHTTCLLGAAKILNELKDEWEGTIKLIFQPGEERNPGGASYMIKEGALENPAPQGIFGMHVHPGLPVGRFSFRKGRVMASADEIFITVKS
ncbi:MAG: M20 metallopeptidase family protein, partial [Segetibacter sp.]